jgi:putative tryptophan/tyrosine transport system substrate-binding protein
MRRRDFIAAAGAATLAPTATLAQQRKMATVALLLGGSFPEFQIGVFRQGLHDLGYVEGQSIRVEIHSAEDDAQRLPELAAALVRDRVDVILPFGTNAALAAKHATSEIPIVLLANGDPVGVGLVNSLAHPGGNVTGTSSMHAELAAKHVELLEDMLPNVRRVAALSNSADAFFGQVFLKQIALAGKARRIEIVPMIVAAGAELDAAFPAMVSRNIEAVIVQGSLVNKHVADLGLEYRLPTVSPFLSFAAMGGLMSYAGAPKGNIRGAARLVDKILKGEKPADLPVQQPSRFELVINLETAKQLGLTIPHTVLLRADEVIE